MYRPLKTPKIYDFQDIQQFADLIIESNFDEEKLIKVIVYFLENEEKITKELLMGSDNYETYFLGTKLTLFKKKQRILYGADMPKIDIANFKLKFYKEHIPKIDFTKKYYCDTLFEIIHPTHQIDIASLYLDNSEDLKIYSNQKKIIEHAIDSLNGIQKKKDLILQKTREAEVAKELKEQKIKEFNDLKKTIELKYNEGLTLFKMKKYPNAIFTLTEAIKLDQYQKYNQDLYYHRGNSKFEVGDYMGCIGDFEQSISLKGNPLEKLFKMGLASFKLNKFNSAIIYFDKTIKLDKSHKEALFYRGLCKIKIGTKEDGCLDLSKAGELGYFEAYEEIKKNCI